jgi:hypothetical protein
MFTEDPPDSDEFCLLDEAGTDMVPVLDRNPDAETRVAGSIETLKFSEATSLAFFAHTFAGASQEDESRSIPRMWLLGVCWATQRAVCPTPVVCRVPETYLFSLTPSRVDQQVPLPKQPVHLILFGLHRGQDLEQRQIRPFLPSLNKTGRCFY